MKKTEVMALLKENQDERGIKHWAKRKPRNSKLKSYGIGLTKLRKMGKQIGRDHKLARQLWKSDVYEAKILGLLIDEPKELTREQVEEQVENLNVGMLSHVFACCDATLAKAPFAIELASKWRDSKDDMRRRCSYLLLYEASKMKSKKAPDDAFFLDCIKQIRNTIHDEENWVKASMTGALLGIGKRNRKLNKAAIRAVKAMGPVVVDYGDNDCEQLDVLKHLTSDYIKNKLGT